MDVVGESHQKSWCAFFFLFALFFLGIHFIFLVTTIAVTSFKFFLAWNHIFRLQRPASLLQAAVNTFVYRRCPQKKEVTLDECPICLSEYDDGDIVSRGNSCRHTFHRDCLQCWMKKQPSCPCCRQNIMEEASYCGEEDSLIENETWARLLEYLKDSMSMLSISQ